MTRTLNFGGSLVKSSRQPPRLNHSTIAYSSNITKSGDFSYSSGRKRFGPLKKLYILFNKQCIASYQVLKPSDPIPRRRTLRGFGSESLLLFPRSPLTTSHLFPLFTACISNTLSLWNHMKFFSSHMHILSLWCLNNNDYSLLSR